MKLDQVRDNLYEVRKTIGLCVENIVTKVEKLVMW